MEFLRKTCVVAIFAVVMFPAVAQVNQQALEDAFSKSYVHEKSGDFKAAADDLKKVYDASSY